MPPVGAREPVPGPEAGEYAGGDRFHPNIQMQGSLEHAFIRLLQGRFFKGSDGTHGLMRFGEVKAFRGVRPSSRYLHLVSTLPAGFCTPSAPIFIRRPATTTSSMPDGS